MAKSRRRGSGEGLVRERADGRWEGRISLGWEGGKRKTKSYFAPTQAAVVEKLLAARSDHSKGLPIAIKSQTVQAFMEDWLEHFCLSGCFSKPQ